MPCGIYQASSLLADVDTSFLMPSVRPFLVQETRVSPARNSSSFAIGYE
jgi:hypothetical protein